MILNKAAAFHTGSHLISSRILSTGRLEKLFATKSNAHPVEVVVVRHGETDWNRQLRVQGTTDIALNHRGKAQAKACAEYLVNRYGDNPPRKVYSSVLSRASDTASAIAEAFSSTRSFSQLESNDRRIVTTHVHNDLSEWNLGVIEGMKKDEAAQKISRDWAVFSQWANPYVSAKDSETKIAQGESMEDVRKRVVTFLEEACREVDSPLNCPVICATHGGVLGQLLRHVAEHGNSPEPILTLCGDNHPQNGSITRFSVVPGEPWEIIEWAETKHLTGEAQPVRTDYNAPVESKIAA
eukprot:CAMPEP_0113944804 /NCGR_PEP_ID=MMETSP1339-20121228/36905_1 /TAXON_ID=94617 /ORGANISM="Fibrocapsa japonica" /LENGTH=295 /DNA_ID=CAMNT_0000950125 /DNA_START=126 /DNA_END=1013 /DNA_ORIENTATION=+ /assembly_acc=CAM_ASM_000762